MIRSILLAMAPCLLFVQAALGQDLTLAPERDQNLVSLLNQMTVLDERGESPEDLAYIVKVILVRNLVPDVCDGTPESCPTEYVYLAISEYGELPTMNLYRLPDAHGWSLDSWISLPKGAPSKDKFVVLRMKRAVIAKDRSKGWFVSEQVEIKMNLDSAVMHPLGTEGASQE